MKIWLLSLLCLIQWAWADTINDAEKWFSTQVPSGWTFDERQKSWHDPANQMAVALKSHPLEGDLKSWAERLAQPSARAKLESFSVAGQPGMRIDYTNAAGYRTLIWITAKGKRGALMTLVFSQGLAKQAESVQAPLLEQFRWLK